MPRIEMSKLVEKMDLKNLTQVLLTHRPEAVA